MISYAPQLNIKELFKEVMENYEESDRSSSQVEVSFSRTRGTKVILEWLVERKNNETRQETLAADGDDWKKNL